MLLGWDGGEKNCLWEKYVESYIVIPTDGCKVVAHTLMETQTIVVKGGVVCESMMHRVKQSSSVYEVEYMNTEK